MRWWLGELTSCLAGSAEEEDGFQLIRLIERAHFHEYLDGSIDFGKSTVF